MTFVEYLRGGLWNWGDGIVFQGCLDNMEN